MFVCITVMHSSDEPITNPITNAHKGTTPEEAEAIARAAYEEAFATTQEAIEEDEQDGNLEFVTLPLI